VSRKRSKVSRSLIAILAIVIVVGLIVYLESNGGSEKNAASPAPAQAASLPAETRSVEAPPAKAPLPSGASALITHTPVAPPAVPTAPSAAPAAKPDAVAQAAPVPPSAASPKPVMESVALSGTPLADAKPLLDGGELLKARAILNTALLSGKLSDTDAQLARQQLEQINRSVIFSPQRYPEDPFQASYTVKSGDRLAKIAKGYDTPWELIARLNNISDPSKIRAGQTLKVIKGPFHAVVDKSDFRMDLYLGSPGERDGLYVMSFPVGLGSDDSTPLGTWMVQPQSKLKNPAYYSPRGEGVIAADDPKNPIGERWIGLEGVDGHAVGKQSYGIHGTIEPASIGKMASMGCIRMLNENVAFVFDLLVEGQSTVVVEQ
jgi:lipoprotein-anchoring transpeptidase ErfK/SrfK